MTTALAHPPQVALFLDAWVSRPAMGQVIELCRDLGARLLCLAPPPGKLAVSRLEPHLDALAHARVEWSILGYESEVGAGLATLPGLARLVCADGSALARYRGALPAPLVILCNPPETRPMARAVPDPVVDWLAPHLHRGF